jgi:hypothetical protein
VNYLLLKICGGTYPSVILSLLYNMGYLVIGMYKKYVLIFLKNQVVGIFFPNTFQIEVFKPYFYRIFFPGYGTLKLINYFIIYLTINIFSAQVTITLEQKRTT